MRPWPGPAGEGRPRGLDREGVIGDRLPQHEARDFGPPHKTAHGGVEDHRLGALLRDVADGLGQKDEGQAGAVGTEDREAYSEGGFEDVE